MRALSAITAFLSMLAAAWSAAATPAASLLYERALMLEADRRCRLFTPPVAAALSTAALQARGAARRAGEPAAALDLLERRAAAKARATPCASSDLTLAAARVRSAHEGWARLSRMDFPGAAAGWAADRTTGEAARWRLVQTTRLGADPLSFGLAAEGAAQPRLVAAAAFDKARPPALARLRIGTRVFLAEDRRAASKTLAPAGARNALAFRFSPAAAVALEQLEPRDTVALEFVTVTPRGETVRSAKIEVGDFAAARAFLLAAR